MIFLLLCAYAAWVLFGPATKFDEKIRYIYIESTDNVKDQVLKQLKEQHLVRDIWAFGITADKMGVWDKVKPGRFEIEKGQNLMRVARTLRNNKQAPSRLVINKLRLREDFAKLIGKNFKTDSATAFAFLNNNDSLRPFGVDTNTVMTLIIPDTYLFNWGTTMNKLLARLKAESDDFWSKNNRQQKAANLGLTPEQVYTVASIVEEETNYNPEKGNIASVYLNRLAKGMALGADPTIKFALKDFSLKRIYYVHLGVISPYNTYKNKGLPPGPICTPSVVTIDAVLNAPRTDYLFFVASSEFNGTHHFSSTFAEHDQYAKEYQKALDERMRQKQNQ
jgi:UPF0755 protein